MLPKRLRPLTFRNIVRALILGALFGTLHYYICHLLIESVRLPFSWMPTAMLVGAICSCFAAASSIIYFTHHRAWAYYLANLGGVVVVGIPLLLGVVRFIDASKCDLFSQCTPSQASGQVKR